MPSVLSLVLVAFVMPQLLKISLILPIAKTSKLWSFKLSKVVGEGGSRAKSWRFAVLVKLPGSPIKGLAIILPTFHSSFKVILLAISQIL